MSLRRLVRGAIQSVDPMATLLDVAGLMQRHKIGSVFVKDRNQWVGIITETDLIRKAIANNLDFDTTTCFLMSSSLICIDIEKSVNDANHQMHFNGVRHLAVSEKGDIVGVISVRDLVCDSLENPEGTLAIMDEIFQPLTILTHRDIHTTSDSTSVKEAAKIMETKKIGSVIITSYGDPVGIVTETDLVRKVIRYNIRPAALPVGVMMNTPIVDIPLSASLRDASRVMAKHHVRHLAVTQAGKIIGIISIRDLIGMFSIRDLPRFFSEVAAV